jgi:hypothetical protein
LLYATEQTHQRALSGGFSLWFTKPLNVDEFVAVLGCFAIYKQSSYAICLWQQRFAIAQEILSNIPRHRDLNIEKPLCPAVPS